jgi:hypothetical protein
MLFGLVATIVKLLIKKSETVGRFLSSRPTPRGKKAKNKTTRIRRLKI